jgi:3-hydroxyacyl-CoA dehydrogenase
MDIKRVLVVGTGTLGRQIGFQCAMHGFETIMYDVSEKALASCREAHEHLAEMFRSERGVPRTTVDAARARLSYTIDLRAAAEDVDIVTESVPEVLETKLDAWKRLGEACPARTIFTTNTSTLLPSQLAHATGRPERFLALHFANRIWDSNIGEVMGHSGTAPEIVEAVLAFARAIGMVPIRIDKEQSGYVINSLLVPWLTAAQSLVTNGIATFTDVDRTWMICTRMGMGPFGLLDVIGLETAFNVMAYWGSANGDAQLLKNAAYLKAHFLDRGSLGVPSGRGYYAYPNPAYQQAGFLD